ncbi:hypothetical protein DFQ28_009851 [Apophysomyces sp. BC1034]|nr:hypothetical protein DFQ29_006307 [Apophysomyces sp. BC1021]KAG0185167.1 hypothetical protein DFQ28_009851 [Apophysomyces sp. BC1034]
MDIADDTFLPTRRDQLKAEINNLRQRLGRARDERQKLKRELIEEKIGHVISAKFSEEIKDPNRHKAVDLKEVQQKTFLRILQDLLQAYVSRREQIEELRQLALQRPSITSINARTAEKNKINIIHNSQFCIKLQYEILAADYPTRVEVLPLSSDDTPQNYRQLERIFYSHKLADAYSIAFE